MNGDVLPAQPGLLARRHVLLNDGLASASAARRVLRDALSSAGREEWTDSAELACTELVANVVLHAHTASEVTIEVFDDRLDVSIRDFSPVLPVQRDYDSHATTGRGLALVAAVVSDHGIRDAGPNGKTIWFTIAGDPATQTEEELLAAWADADWDLDGLEGLRGEAAVDASPEHGVTLVGLPPTLWLAARQHHDALIRELVLYQAEHEQPDDDVVAADRARAIISTAVWDAVRDQQQAGSAHAPLPEGHPTPLPPVPAPLDLPLRVPHELAGAFTLLQETLDEGEKLAAAGVLLTRPGLPEIVAVRDWACEQIVAQIAGVHPSRWPGTAQERFTAEVRPPVDEPVASFDVASVAESDGGVIAVDEANRIVAISAPLARLVGWSPEDLIGRRIVTLIPPRFREAHVAGFTRHLTTGEAHILGVPLTLPVLTAGSDEIMCEVLINRVAGGTGRNVYVAQIEPAQS